jgi:hypothetical protein
MIIRTHNGNNGEPITEVIDSTGLKTSTKESYIENRWKKEREEKVFKLHILTDKKTGKIAESRASAEHAGGSKKFEPLVRKASKKNKIGKASGDTSYDAGGETCLSSYSQQSFKTFTQERSAATKLETLSWRQMTSAYDLCTTTYSTQSFNSEEATTSKDASINIAIFSQDS